MIFHKCVKNYITLFRIHKHFKEHGPKYNTKSNETENNLQKPLAAKTKKFKPCSSSTPMPCKPSYVARLQLPYYKAIKTVKDEHAMENNIPRWGPLKITPNPTPGTPPDHSNVQMDEKLQKAFDDIKREKARLCAKLEERLQKKNIIDESVN